MAISVVPSRCSAYPTRCRAGDDGRSSVAAHGVLNVVAALRAIVETLTDVSIELPPDERVSLSNDARDALTRLDESLRLTVMGLAPLEACEREAVSV